MNVIYKQFFFSFKFFRIKNKTHGKNGSIILNKQEPDSTNKPTQQDFLRRQEVVKNEDDANLPQARSGV